MSPVVFVSRPVVERNIERYHARFKCSSVALRAHVKGHRTVELARFQEAAGASGIAVHTTAEARRYLASGITDIVLAWPLISPERWSFFADFSAFADARGATVSAHVGDPDAVRQLGVLCTAAGTDLALRIDVHFDDRGIAPERVLDLARLVETTPGVHLDGVTGYWGPATDDEVRNWDECGRAMARTLVEVAGEVRADGMTCPTVAVGGTPNALAVLDVPGVTEVCGGAYALWDSGSAEAGLCTLEDVAVSVRATVLDVADGAIRTDADELLADASQDWAPEIVAVRADGTPFTEARAGEVVDLIPAHLCPFVKKAGQLVVTDDDGRPEGKWDTLYFGQETNR
ncbi:predicted protein [Streptomyces sp. AA4]|nr:predicted protein [Streptomyces sp. AA4]